MISALGSAASGIRAGFAMLDRAAADIARSSLDQAGAADIRPAGGGSAAAPLEGGGLAESLVSTIIARHTVAVNAGVMRRADQALGSLIDVLA